MFDSLWKTEKTKCVHPKWEILKDISIPSIAEQMQLETLPPDQKIQILKTLKPADFNKISLSIMSCPFCGEVKEFKAEQNYEDRPCAHQWEIHDVKMPSSFEKTCGDDATFDQRQSVASKMVPEDFNGCIIRRTTCTLCGRVEEKTIRDEFEGSENRCAHNWKVQTGDLIKDAKDTWSKTLGNYKEVRIKQAVLMTCEICGTSSTKELNSVIQLIVNKSKK